MAECKHFVLTETQLLWQTAPASPGESASSVLPWEVLRGLDTPGEPVNKKVGKP